MLKLRYFIPFIFFVFGFILSAIFSETNLGLLFSLFLLFMSWCTCLWGTNKFCTVKEKMHLPNHTGGISFYINTDGDLINSDEFVETYLTYYGDEDKFLLTSSEPFSVKYKKGSETFVYTSVENNSDRYENRQSLEINFEAKITYYITWIEVIYFQSLKAVGFEKIYTQSFFKSHNTETILGKDSKLAYFSWTTLFFVFFALFYWLIYISNQPITPQ